MEFLSASILAAPFRAVGPRDQERFQREILIDSLAPLFLGLIDATDEIVALDLGCGIGIPSLFLALAIGGSSFIGIDSSQKRLAFGRDLARSADIHNLEFVESRLRLDLALAARTGNTPPRNAELAVARAMAKPDLLLPYVIAMMRGGLKRFLLYSTVDSLRCHESILEKARSHGLETRIHFYRRPSPPQDANDQSPSLDYALLELIRKS